MYPLFFIAPIAIVVIGYMVLRTQGSSSKLVKPTSVDKSWTDIPAMQSDDSNDQGSQVKTHSHQQSHLLQDNSSELSNCNDMASADTSSVSSSNSSWDSGSSSCSVDSTPSVDSSSY